MEEFVRAALSFGFGSILTTVLFKADEYVSKDARVFVTRMVQGWHPGPIVGPEYLSTFTQVFDVIFGPDPTSRKFVCRVLLVSSLSISGFFIAFLVINPYAWQAFFDPDPILGPRRRGVILEEIISTTLLVNFGVDYICLTYCRTVIGRTQRMWSWLGVPALLIKDIGGKIVLFTTSMGLYYAFAAQLGLGFGGDTVLAIKALLPTLRDGLRMGNMTGIYIYSSLISSFWLWAYLLSSIVIRGAQAFPVIWRKILWVLPIEEKPLRSIGVVSGILLALGFMLWTEVLRRFAM